MQKNEYKPLTAEQIYQLQEWAKRQEAKRQREALCKSCPHCNAR
jgi:hypothetical protein